MSHVFPRNEMNTVPLAVSTEGCFIVDSDGRRYFDGSGGAAISSLGHSNARVVTAVQDQVTKLAFAHTSFFTSEPAEELANLLIKNAPGTLDKVYFVSGGSEAIEAALKLARQYHIENGQPERRHFISRRQSYHGNTLGALAVGGNEWRRQQFSPLLFNVSHIAPCYEYVNRDKNESSFDYGQRVAQELEDEILQLGPETVIAFIAEPVVGATLGAVPAVEGYFGRVREICDKYGVLLILDEVMCGMGRTGHLFACEADNVIPDILCIAKGLGAGYQPIGAMLCSASIYHAIENGTGFFQHGHSYLGHPVAVAAALAVVKELLDKSLIDRSKVMGDKLENALFSKLGQNPHVGDIRGRGLFRGVELVYERETKTPFDPDRSIAAKVKATAFDFGLLCYPMAGTRDGRHGDHVLLAPPFILEDTHIDLIVDTLSKAIDAAILEP